MLARRRRIALVCVAAVITAACGFNQYATTHRSLSYWVTVLGYSADRFQPNDRKRDEALGAIRKFGTNSIPSLIEWLSYNKPPPKVKQVGDRLLYRFPLMRKIPGFESWALCNDRRARTSGAIMAFQALGTNAAPAIAQLVSIACDPNLSTPQVYGAPQLCAVDALFYTGKCAVPALVSVITNKEASARFHAITALKALGTNAAQALPALVRCTSDSSTDVAAASLEALGQIELNPRITLPPIIQATKDPRPTVRSYALTTLGSMGKDARPATPALLHALTDDDPTVRRDAEFALGNIAPESLPKPRNWLERQLFNASHQYPLAKP
jgi:HEAT repeat protein